MFHSFLLRSPDAPVPVEVAASPAPRLPLTSPVQLTQSERKKTMQLSILGNSGSGKSTLAKWVANRHRAALLDLDTVAWVPGQIAVPRPEAEAGADVLAFCKRSADWVIEGCYANLIEASLALQPKLVLLNPGVEQCLSNCRARPWEPHKYPSKEEQDERLAFLEAWVCDYETRAGPMSLAAHRALFDAYAGPKLELRAVPDLELESAPWRQWLEESHSS